MPVTALRRSRHRGRQRPGFRLASYLPPLIASLLAENLCEAGR
ncbi:hypothetical protein SAMN06265784_103384 [Paraburkholderia susongensis]|uniref:Uncharacterized protein n=1 Tax=Paraburkholderia susongensis TaxID=1515439 RepID=A0A1X7K6B9_9BURK|nr:hypothetical protein SAMN06265784_103384 [Paraburkholderia susongensis]